MLLIFLLIALAKAQSIENQLIQGPMSVQAALLSWKKLSFYTTKNNVTFKNFTFDPSQFDSFDEQTYRHKSHCGACDKAFKNSSFTLFHYYRYHLSEEQQIQLIMLNYMCSFINCQIIRREQYTFSQIKFKKCLHFAQQYLQGSIWNVTVFCEEIISDSTDFSKSLWEEIYPFLRRAGLIIFFGCTIFYEYRTYQYFKTSDILFNKKVIRQRESEQSFKISDK